MQPTHHPVALSQDHLLRPNLFSQKPIVPLLERVSISQQTNSTDYGAPLDSPVQSQFPRALAMNLEGVAKLASPRRNTCPPGSNFDHLGTLSKGQRNAFHNRRGRVSGGPYTFKMSAAGDDNLPLEGGWETQELAPEIVRDSSQRPSDLKANSTFKKRGRRRGGFRSGTPNQQRRKTSADLKISSNPVRDAPQSFEATVNSLPNVSYSRSKKLGTIPLAVLHFSHLRATIRWQRITPSFRADGDTSHSFE